MSPAPRLKGYVCSLCGNESIQTPWGEEDFVCSEALGGCGATNKGPLITLEERQAAVERGTLGRLLAVHNLETNR